MKWIRRLLLVFLVLSIGVATWESKQTQRVLMFERTIESKRNAAEIEKSVFQLKYWPSWHHQLYSATFMSEKVIQMHLKPKGWKNLYLDWEVLEWAPPSHYKLRLLKDSSDKLLKAFQWVEVEILIKNQTTITGRVRAETRSSRVRFLSRFSERIILNQVFYPDLNFFKFTEEKAQGMMPPGF